MSFLTAYRKLLVGQTDNHPVWRYNPKLGGRMLADDLAVPMPRLFGYTEKPSGVWPYVHAAHAIHELAVIKPNHGSTSRAVLPLTRDLRGLKQDAVADEKGWTLWLEEQARATNQRIAGPWLVEEGMMHPDGTRHADDLRVYVFGGRAQFVQRDANDPQHPTNRRAITWAFWDPYGNRIAAKKLAMVSRQEAPQDAPRPKDLARILYWAERIASKVETSFLRVDFLEGRERVVFGELTPHPGPLTNQKVHISPDFDEELGRHLPVSR